MSLEGLSVLGADGRALPRLADHWTWEKDGLSLRVTLREGVAFHDGTRLTSDAVAAALRSAIARPGNQALYSSFGNIAAVRTEGTRDVILDLSRRSAFLPEDLEFKLGIGPNNVGTGAFRVVTREPSEIVLERFEQYPLGRSQIERVVISSTRTLRTAWTSLLRGEIDVVTNIPPEAIEFVSNDDVQVISVPRSYQFMLAFNSQKAPLSNPAVRRALNLAVDREELIQKALRGRATPSTGPLWPQYWAYDKSILPYSFDPGLAAALLDGAGLPVQNRTGGPPSRFRFTVLIPADFSQVERVALALQKQLYNVGVDVQFAVTPARDFDAQIRSGRFDAILIEMVSGPTIGRAHILWRSAKQFKGLNVFGYENPETERLFDVLTESTNEAAIRSATSRLQRAFLQDPPALFLAWTQNSRAIRRQFRVPAEPGRDPLATIWQWAPAPVELRAQVTD